MLVRSALALFIALFSSYASGFDVASRAYDVTIKDMKPDEWKKFLRKMHDQYETWSNDNQGGGSMKNFLDDRMISIAPSVRSGDIKVLKKFVYLLALYHHNGEPPPWYLRELADDNLRDLEELMNDFSWERASQMIRSKSREYDRDPEKSKKLDRLMPQK